jgi:hypothetical protein
VRQFIASIEKLARQAYPVKLYRKEDVTLSMIDRLLGGLIVAKIRVVLVEDLNDTESHVDEGNFEKFRRLCALACQMDENHRNNAKLHNYKVNHDCSKVADTEIRNVQLQEISNVKCENHSAIPVIDRVSVVHQVNAMSNVCPPYACWICHKYGHFKVNCSLRRNANVRVKNAQSVHPNEEKYQSDYELMGGPVVYCQAEIFQQNVSCQIDSGATNTLVTTKVLREIAHANKWPDGTIESRIQYYDYPVVVRGITGHSMNIVGVAKIPLVFTENAEPIVLTVLVEMSEDKNYDVLLGTNALHLLDMLKLRKFYNCRHTCRTVTGQRTDAVLGYGNAVPSKVEKSGFSCPVISNYLTVHEYVDNVRQR